MSRKVAPPTPKPKSWVHNYTSRARKPEIPYTIRLTPTRPSTVKPDNLPSQPMRDIYKVKPESIFASSPQIDNTRPKPQTSRDQFQLDHTRHPESDQATDGTLYPLLTMEHLLAEDASQGIATFIDQINKFTSRLTGPVPEDLTALVEYQQDSLVIMRMATREVVRTVERRLGLGRGEINDEEGFQTWSNGMLAYSK
jgi:hypothetical protein